MLETDSRTIGRPPAWARAADVVCLALVALAIVIAVSGGIRIRTAWLRLSLTSPSRVLLLALLVGVGRHVLAPRVPITRDLPGRLARWTRVILPSEPVESPPEALTARFVAGLIALFTALAFVMTYPLVWHMRDAVADTGDPLLNVWALSWVLHQLPRDPAHLFDGNIFAPERNTLAYSETLIAPALLVAPLRWMGGGGILIHNVAFVLGMVLSGVGAALLVRDLTRSTAAAVVSGTLFAFMPFRFDHIAQVQLQQAQWIPLAFWSFHRAMRTGRIRYGVWLGVCVAAQLLSCMYYGIFLAAYVTVVGGIIAIARASTLRTRLPSLAVAVVVALVLFAPAARAYLGAHEIVGERGTQENISFSATWSNYLAAPDTNRLYGWTAARYGALERLLFPGVVAVALAAVALWPPLSVVRAAYAVGLAFAVDLTLGFNGLTYRFLYEHVPLFRALRIPALAIVLVGFSLAVLAGFGVARLSTVVRSVRGRALLAGMLGAAALVESASFPVALTIVPPEAPEVYADLLRDRAAAGGSAPATIVEVPIIFSRDSRFQDQIYMYYSTFHWQKLVNGYSGFFPPPYMEAAAVMHTFPDARSIDTLRRRGTNYVVIHGERLEPEEYRRLIGGIDACGCGLTLVARRPWLGREISVYRLRT